MSGWVIDVCRTCGRIATWPFCEHRPKGYVPYAAEAWCVAISVAPTTQQGREFARLNAERVTRERHRA